MFVTLRGFLLIRFSQKSLSSSWGPLVLSSLELAFMVALVVPGKVKFGV